LVNHVLAVWVLKGDGAGWKEAAAFTLFSRVDVAANSGDNLAVREGLSVDAAGTVNAWLGRLEMRCIERGIHEPLDCDGHLVC
jgi:hypothetical protein